MNYVTRLEIGNSPSNHAPPCDFRSFHLSGFTQKSSVYLPKWPHCDRRKLVLKTQRRVPENILRSSVFLFLFPIAAKKKSTQSWSWEKLWHLFCRFKLSTARYLIQLRFVWRQRRSQKRFVLKNPQILSLWLAVKVMKIILFLPPLVTQIIWYHGQCL